jgi:hypothetical protein
LIHCCIHPPGTIFFNEYPLFFIGALLLWCVVWNSIMHTSNESEQNNSISKINTSL